MKAHALSLKEPKQSILHLLAPKVISPSVLSFVIPRDRTTRHEQRQTQSHKTHKQQKAQKKRRKPEESHSGKNTKEKVIENLYICNRRKKGRKKGGKKNKWLYCFLYEDNRENWKALKNVIEIIIETVKKRRRREMAVGSGHFPPQ